MNNRIKKTDSKFKCNIFLFLSVTVFMARLSVGTIIIINILAHSQLSSLKNALVRLVLWITR
jgi:hypothetical protein